MKIIKYQFHQLFAEQATKLSCTYAVFMHVEILCNEKFFNIIIFHINELVFEVVQLKIKS
jgi:hypothetical protein